MQHVITVIQYVIGLRACRQLSDEFRESYAEFWHALVLQNADGVRIAAQNMHAGSLYRVFTSMLTQKPWADVAEKGSDPFRSRSTEEVRALRPGDLAHLFIIIALTICV